MKFTLMRFWNLAAAPLLALTYCSFCTAAVTVSIRDFATIPDQGPPARMSVMTQDAQGRLFVNNQNGPLYIVDRQTRNVSAYLNLADSTAFPDIGLVSGGERGFQSFAFHPDFHNAGTAGFGKLYTIHSSNNNTPTPDFDPGGPNALHSVLLEWSTSDPSASTFQPASASQPFREVMRLQQFDTNHNTGQIAFNTSVSQGSADRNHLYIAVGDGGGGNDPRDTGQDTSNPFGAILRIDPLGNDSANGQYGIVSENVLAADGNSQTLGEIFSYGLRNPQRFGWDDQTGGMYIADIGQNSFEEINLGQNGGNFGWDIREGSTGTTPTGLIDPVADYDHGDFLIDPITASRAITVGEVYRGSEIAGLDGQLLLGDFPNGVIYTLDVDGDPLDGGSAGLEELILLDDDNNPVRLIDLMRRELGDENFARADLRFSYGIDGEVFILNKHDNVIRHLVTAVPEPSTAIPLAMGLIGWVAHRRTRRKTVGASPRDRAARWARG